MPPCLLHEMSTCVIDKFIFVVVFRFAPLHERAECFNSIYGKPSDWAHTEYQLGCGV